MVGNRLVATDLLNIVFCHSDPLLIVKAVGAGAIRLRIPVTRRQPARFAKWLTIRESLIA